MLSVKSLTTPRNLKLDDLLIPVLNPLCIITIFYLPIQVGKKVSREIPFSEKLTPVWNLATKTFGKIESVNKAFLF